MQIESRGCLNYLSLEPKNESNFGVLLKFPGEICCRTSEGSGKYEGSVSGGPPH